MLSSSRASIVIAISRLLLLHLIPLFFNCETTGQCSVGHLLHKLKKKTFQKFQHKEYRACAWLMMKFRSHALCTNPSVHIKYTLAFNPVLNFHGFTLYICKLVDSFICICNFIIPYLTLAH